MANLRYATMACLVVAFSVLFMTVSQAQSCTTHQQAVTQLEAKYGEKPRHWGMDSGGALITLFASDDGSTWTIVVTMPTGCASILAAGNSWADIIAKVGEQS